MKKSGGVWYNGFVKGNNPPDKSEVGEMKMIIVKANENQYDDVRCFYHFLIDGMQKSTYDIGWKKDIYPSPEFLQASIANGELYVGIENGEIIASMVLNHQCNDGYKKFHWQTEATEDEITVIHALGVNPAQTGKGFAKVMVKKAIEIATNNCQKAIRLDVLRGNLPAEKLYTQMGFQYMHTLQMYYEDTGWTDYELYEYVLN